MFLFIYFFEMEGYISTAKIIKTASSYQLFQPEHQLATMQSFYFISIKEEYQGHYYQKSKRK